MIELVSSMIDLSPLPQITDNALQNVLNVVFALTGAIAVLIIVLSGLRLIWSRGDPQATAKARSAIGYAVAGLIIVIAAFAITTFIINIL